MAVKRIQTEMCMELAGNKYPVDMIRKTVREVVEKKFPDTDVKKIGIYMQPETNFIYYTVNGEGSVDQCISFDDLPTE